MSLFYTEEPEMPRFLIEKIWSPYIKLMKPELQKLNFNLV
jgi:hypothetical protein